MLTHSFVWHSLGDMDRVVIIVGARPNFMKAGPVCREFEARGMKEVPYLIHTGQHYDENMSKCFFEDLGLPQPDVYLGIGSGSHAEQTAKVMMALEPVLQDAAPDAVMVVGDVNSTMAGAITAAKLRIPVVHLEAGLRSFDRSMPEEINRMVTDAIADLLLTSCRDGDENLLREGVPREKIRFVGNVMVDSLVQHLAKSRDSGILDALGVGPRGYVAVTLHRPSNVDNPETLALVLAGLERIGSTMPVIFPVHPRTRAMIAGSGHESGTLRLLGPLGYLDFLHLMSNAAVVVTDSGGVQEETTYLGIPCLTVRPNTERPVTVTEGTNRLISGDTASLLEAFEDARARVGQPAPAIDGWDGHAAGRVVDALVSLYTISTKRPRR